MKGIFNNLAQFLYGKYLTYTLPRKYPEIFSPKSKKQIIESFNRLFYHSTENWYRNTKWLGTNILKCPTDLWIYQEIISEIKPDLIIETGTYKGGSTLFMATICDALNHGEIVTIDIHKPRKLPKHPRITYIHGSVFSKSVVNRVNGLSKNKRKVLVVLDSEHREKHVLKEIGIYHKYVTKGSYLIVEDTNINGHPVDPHYGPGPYEAVMKFLKKNKSFRIDDSRERLLITFNPNGFLKRIS